MVGLPVEPRHGIIDMVVAVDAVTLVSGNLRELHDAGLRFTVGSRVTKAPNDLVSHFHWHGDVFTDRQVIDTISTREHRGTEANTTDPKREAEPIWNRPLIQFASRLSSLPRTSLRELDELFASLQSRAFRGEL